MSPSYSLSTQPLLQGDSEQFPLSDILPALSRRHVTGVLYLEPSGLCFYIRDGYLDAVSGVEPLGHILLHMGLLDAYNLKDFHHTSPTPLGLSLVKQGKLELYDLWLALANQARLGISRMLRLKKQTFSFLPHEPLPGPSASLDIPEAILEAVGSKYHRHTF